jgi:hypothetical protein
MSIDLSDLKAGGNDIFYDFDAIAELEAAKVNCKVVYPAPNQLQLDLDSDLAYEYMQRRLEDVENRLQWEYEIDVRPSRSGLPHRHVYITVEDKTFDEWERIAMQVMLGSDPVREGLNALRLAAGQERPTRLFEPL